MTRLIIQHICKNTNKIQSAFKIDQSKIKVDFGNINNILNQNSLPTLDINDVLSNIKFSMSSEDIQKLMTDLLNGYEEYIQKNPDANLAQISKQLSDYLQSKEASELLNKKIQEIIKENGSLSFTQEQIQDIMTEILKGYQQYVDDNELISVDDLNKYLIEYLESEEAKTILNNNLSQLIKSQNLDTQISTIMEKYLQNVMGTISQSLQKQMQSSIATLSKSITEAISIDEETFISAFQFKMNEDELEELFQSLITKELLLHCYYINLKMNLI